MKTFVMMLALAVIGCGSNEGIFKCTSDRDCTAPGGQDKCIAGYCAAPDTSCPSGYRYDKTAGPDANQCTPIGSNDLSMSLPDLGRVIDDMAAPLGPPDMAFTVGDMAAPIRDMTAVGTAWQAVGGGTASVTYEGIYGADKAPGDIFVIGGDGSVGKWTGTNFAFASATSAVLDGICGSAATDLYIVGSGTILHSTDSGLSWHAPTTAPAGTDLYYGCLAVSATDVYVFGYTVTSSAPVIYHSVDHGATWTPQTITGLTGAAAGAILHSGWASTATDIYIVGEQGLILHSAGQPGGGGPAVFTQQTSGITKTLWSIWGSAATDIYVAASGGNVLHSAGGGSWGSPINISTQDIQGVWGSSATDIFFVGANGVIFHSPGGLAFVARNSTTTQNFRRVFVASGLAIAVGTGGAIFAGQ